jgi:hypothetical protein
MAGESIGNILSEYSDRLRELSEITGRYRDSVTSDYERGLENRKRWDAETEKSAKKLTEGLNKVSSATGSFYKQLERGDGSFQALATAMNLAINATGGLIKAIAKEIPIVRGLVDTSDAILKGAVNHIADSFQKFYSDFERTAGAGVVNSTMEFKKTIDAAKLNIGDTSKLLTKYSKELAYFGGSATAGRERFDELARSSQVIREDFQKLGVSAVDFSDYQLSYLTRLQRQGQLENKTTSQLISGTQEYIKNLDYLSKVTGLTKDQIQQDLDKRMRDPRYRAAIAGTAFEKEVSNLMTIMENEAPNIAEGLKDLIASGGIPVTEQAKATLLQLSQGGLDMREFITGITEQGMSAEKAFAIVASAAGKSASQVKDFTKIVANSTMINKDYVEMENLSKREEITYSERLKKAQEETLKNKKGENTELANIKTSMYNVSTRLQLLGTEVGIVRRAFNFFSDSIEDLTEWLYTNILKDSTPEWVKHRAKDRALLKEENELREKLVASDKEEAIRQVTMRDTTTSSLYRESASRQSQRYTTTRPALEKQIEEKAAERAAVGQQAQESRYSASPARLSPKIENIINRLAEIDPGAQWTSKNTGKHNPGSKHYKGLAFDFVIPNMPINDPEARASKFAEISEKLKKMGASVVVDELTRPPGQQEWSGPHYHVEVDAYKDGGIVNKPTIGLIGEVESEAVIPLKNGNVPVQMNSGLFREMINRLDTLIVLMDRNISMQDDVYRQLT